MNDFCIDHYFDADLRRETGLGNVPVASLLGWYTKEFLNSLFSGQLQSEDITLELLDRECGKLPVAERMTWNFQPYTNGNDELKGRNQL